LFKIYNNFVANYIKVLQNIIIADVIEVGTILESNSPNTKPLPPHTDFQISHLYDHDEFEVNMFRKLDVI